MFSPYHPLERAKIFKRFSLAVDEMENYRKKLTPEERKTSKILHELYVKADRWAVRLKRLGDL